MVATGTRLADAITAAEARGFRPGLYRRGDVWRVHLNVAGDTWEDVRTLDEVADWLWKMSGARNVDGAKGGT